MEGGLTRLFGTIVERTIFIKMDGQEKIFRASRKNHSTHFFEKQVRDYY